MTENYTVTFIPETENVYLLYRGHAYKHGNSLQIDWHTFNWNDVQIVGEPKPFKRHCDIVNKTLCLDFRLPKRGTSAFRVFHSLFNVCYPSLV